MKYLYFSILLCIQVTAIAQAPDTLWTKCIGGTGFDNTMSMTITPTQGFIMAGYTNSTDEDISKNQGSYDVWIASIDPFGDTIWIKTFGGTGSDQAYSVTISNDSGYIAAGSTNSILTNGDVYGNHGDYDAWLINLDEDGNVEWTKCIGGTESDFATTITSTDDGNYIMSGYTNSTDEDINGQHGSYDAWIVKLNQAGDTLWTKCLGGSSYDHASSITTTGDDGYIVAGYTNSSDGDVHGNHGNSDAWIVKLNTDGDTLWTKCLGGSNDDLANSIISTEEGGYIITGYTNSSDGDINNWHEGYDIRNDSTYDFWVIKLDNNGNTIWTKCFGGTSNDYAYSIQTTDYNEYIIVGGTTSEDGDIHGSLGGTSDAWIVKLNETGDTLWTKCLGGTDYDRLTDIAITDNNEFIIAGTTASSDGDVPVNHGGDGDAWIIKLNEINDRSCFGGTSNEYAKAMTKTSDDNYIIVGYTNSDDENIHGYHGGTNDIWIIKLDENADTLWTKCLGGTGSDIATSVTTTSDGGYIIVGYSDSSDGDVTNNNGNTDFWVINLDTDGDILWSKCFGGISSEYANSIAATNDGGYIIAGSTRSNNGDVSSNHGSSDAWLVKLDSTGNIVWTKCFGGTGSDIATSITTTSDGGYIMAGYSNSSDGDVTNNNGNYDIWIVKLNEDGDTLWTKCLGGTENDYATSIVSTDDGYITTGCTYSNNGDINGYFGNGDIFTLKLDKEGNILWSKCYGGTSKDYAYSISTANGGGYIIAGETESSDGNVSGNNGNTDAWIIRINEDGDIWWSDCYGGSIDEYAVATAITDIGEYIVAGSTLSSDGDIINNYGNYDIWFYKFRPEITLICEQETYYSCNEELNIDLALYDVTYPLSISIIHNEEDTPLNKFNPYSKSVIIPQSIVNDFDNDYQFLIETDNNIDTSNTFSISLPPVPEINPYTISVNNTDDVNEIIWLPSADSVVVTYYIYKEMVSNQYDEIGSVEFNDSCFLIDADAVPSMMTARYKIAVEDTCGIVNTPGYYHETMNLSITHKTDRNILTWNLYEDESGEFIYDTFYILKGTNATNISLYDTINIRSYYTDTDIHTDTTYYYIIAIKRDDTFIYSNISICEQPDVDFEYSQACFPGTTVFSNTSETNIYANTSFEWDINNNDTVDFTTTDAEFEFPEAGEYEVKLTASNMSCSNEIVQTITVLPVPEFDLTPASDTTICLYDDYSLSVNITNDITSPSFTWSNFEQTSSIDIEETGTYSVNVSNNGCIGISDSVTITVKEPYNNEEICLVTVDFETQKNEIIWWKTPDVNTKGYIIYKEIAFDYYEAVGSVSFDSLSLYTDYDSEPASHGDKYKIVAVDGCGNISDESPYHKTINLTVSRDGTTRGLRWDNYEVEDESFTPSQYYIYRGTDKDNMEIYDSVTGSFNSYNDTLVYADYLYMVGFEKESPCYAEINSSGLKSSSGPYSQSMSNISEAELADVISESSEVVFTVYPNPVEDQLNFILENISNDEFQLEVINSLGQAVYSRNIIITDQANISINTANLITGCYTLKISNNDFVLQKQFVKQ